MREDRSQPPSTRVGRLAFTIMRILIVTTYLSVVILLAYVVGMVWAFGLPAQD